MMVNVATRPISFVETIAVTSALGRLSAKSRPVDGRLWTFSTGTVQRTIGSAAPII